MTSTIPFPPLELATRVGSVTQAAEPFALYEELGRASKETLLSLLPEGWSFESKRVLDFGCGAGRTLRHFVDEASKSQVFYGCDIDEASIAWLREHLSPPFEVFVNDALPPLPLADASLDLVYAVSVFSHLTDGWSDWLLELHRVLDENGLLIATFIGAGAANWITDEPWEEDRVGMNILRPGQSWELGGPMVLHSPWWIRAHWGRAFEVLELRPSGFAVEPGSGQGVALMRKRPKAPTAKDLERPEPGEPRELSALAANVRQLVRESAELRADHERLADAWRGEKARADEAARELAEREQQTPLDAENWSRSLFRGARAALARSSRRR